MKVSDSIQRLLRRPARAGPGTEVGIGYACLALSEDSAAVSAELAQKIRSAGVAVGINHFIDSGAANGGRSPLLTAAPKRAAFRALLALLKPRRGGAQGARTVEDARAAAEAASKLLSLAMDAVPVSPRGSGPLEGASTPTSWVVFVRRLGELGPRADAIAKGIAQILKASAHVVVDEAGVDSRKDSGRQALAAMLVLEEAGRTASRRAVLERIERARAEMRPYAGVKWGFRKEQGRLVPVREDLAIAEMILSMKAKGITAPDIAVYLNGHQMWGTRKKGWTPEAVARVAGDDIYERALAEIKRAD